MIGCMELRQVQRGPRQLCQEIRRRSNSCLWGSRQEKVESGIRCHRLCLSRLPSTGARQLEEKEKHSKTIG